MGGEDAVDVDRLAPLVLDRDDLGSAASGDVDIAKLLLAKGARVDAVSPPPSGKFTPLMMAAREGHDDAALLLLAQGADPTLKNGEGLTAAQIAEKADHASIAKAINERGGQRR